MTTENTAPETGASAEGSVEIRDTPDANGMIPVSEVAGLKSTLEKLKAEVANLKPKASLVDQIAEQGIDPNTVASKIAALKQQQEQEQLLEQRLAEAQARYKAEQAEIERRYLEQIQAKDKEISANKRQRALESVLAETGAPASVFGDFEVLASRYIEFGEDNQIKSFKSPSGEMFFVEDEKQAGKVRPAGVADFVVAAKKGEYGPALQALLPAFNQSSGAGIASGGGSGSGGKLVLRQSQLADIAKLTPAQLKAVQAGDYTLIE